MQVSVQEVAEHIFEFQVPLPFKLKDINLFLVKSDDGCLLIDTGTNTPATAEALKANTEPFDHWLMLGETLAHLELLEARDQVERMQEGDFVHFRCAPNRAEAS